VLQDAATGCDSNCWGDEAGLGKAADAGVCADGCEDAFTDCCALAFRVRSKKVAIIPRQILISQHRDFVVAWFELFEAAIQWR